MATALQKQLAAIAANSTHQLDLKAQKQRHGKSLLFEPREAASQSFDTIFQICYEGFEELCMLDSRFTSFSRNLFSEQSKDEDRTQMTAKENEELDKTLQSFLGLVCGRLLLQPAMKAVEWVVRRFRVQEYNTEWTLLTFLPYHGSHIFSTLMSILPEQLPPSFRFLHPYVASLQSPPRHAVLSAAISNQAFFSAFSQYVLTVAKARHHSAVLLGFWASITAQAVNGMIDSTRSGRESVRKQREEDLLLRILPVLQSAISIKDVQELYLGSCMIMTILGTKASLQDNVLDAMMEAVAGAWTEETMTEGVTCLALLAEEKHNVSQPARVTSILFKSTYALGCLTQLSQQQRVSKLVLTTAVGLIDGFSRSFDQDGLAFLRSLLDADLMTENHFSSMLESLLPRINGLKQSERGEHLGQTLSRMLRDLVVDEGKLALLVKAAQTTNTSLQSIDLEDLRELTLQDEEEPEPMAIDSTKDEGSNDDFKSVLQKLPSADVVSFLDPGNNSSFQQYLHAFEAALSSNESLDRLFCQNYLCKSRASDRPTFLTFTARVWSSGTSQAAKAQAIQYATSIIQAQEEVDFQVLLPYAFTSLADSSRRIRKAAAELCLAINKAYGQDAKDARAWANKTAYGDSTKTLHFLPSDEAHKFVKHAVLPGLEDCILDRSHAARYLASNLNTENVKQLKKSARQATCSFLASHALVTPALPVRNFVLRVLSDVGKIAGEGRTKFLLPLVNHWAGLNEHDARKVCANGDTSLEEIDKAIIGAISHRTTDEQSTLQDLAFGRIGNRSEPSMLAFQRLRRLWASMSDDSQLNLVDALLQTALAITPVSEQFSRVQADALDALRSISLPGSVLVHLIDGIPNATDLQDRAPAAKKRRTSGIQSNIVQRPVDQQKLQTAIRHITLVLELVEASKPETHPELLKGLFHLLSELHHYRSLSGSELVYLQGILLGCLNSVVLGIQQTGTPNADRSVIRTDLIVECVRTMTSTQIHNAALLLMSSLASWAPELVLHSVMPLFTFMSSTSLRQHDDFSAHVTDQTVARIVPPLAASLKKKGKDLVTGAAELLLSFAAAFEHIPLHRRLGLFQHLVETLGADETLFGVIAMLVERYGNEGAVSTFNPELLNHFKTSTALKAATQYLDLVFDALRPKRKLADVLLGFGDKDEEAREDSVDDLLEGLAGLLENGTLRERLAVKQADEEQAATVRSTYSALLEKTMQLTRDLASNADLKESANTVLGSVLGLMPTGDFIDSSAQLMQTGSHETRQQVFRSLEARVVQARRGDKEAQEVFVGVLPNCGVFIAKSQPVATRHAAISCVDQICEKFGKTDPDAVLSVAENVASDAALESEDQSLRVISVLCVASMVEVLGDGAVAILSPVLKQTLEYMRETLKVEPPSEQLLSAGFSLLGSVLDHLPWMLSGKYLDDALTLAAKTRESADADYGRAFTDLASSKVAPGELFASAERVWENVTGEDGTAAETLLEVLQRAVAHHSKATVTKNAASLFAVLLRAFDLRRDVTQHADAEDAEDTFSLVDQLALDTTLKLNDATFRPFFIRLVEWSTALPKKDVRGRDLRAKSLFSFTLSFFEQLKSIVTSYASFVLDSAVEVLQRENIKEPAAQQLLDVVLKTLSSSFQNDQDDFWQAPSHFDTVAEPLINQLVKARSIAAGDQIIPTITDLAAVSSSPEHLKTINNRLMQFMKHQDAAVRLAAVQGERSITEKLTFDWLALLPEMLPAISEAQEDDDEDVEREVLRWVRQVEDVTGESLEGMLA